MFKLTYELNYRALETRTLSTAQLQSDLEKNYQATTQKLSASLHKLFLAVHSEFEMTSNLNHKITKIRNFAKVQIDLEDKPILCPLDEEYEEVSEVMSGRMEEN